MNEFKKMIEQDDIKVFDLIKGSWATIRQNFGKFMAAMFTFIAFSIIINLIFGFFAADIATSPFMYYLNRFITSLLLFVVSSVIFVGVYYTILGYKDKAQEKSKGEYAKRAAILYVTIYLISSILFVLLIFGFTFIFALTGGEIYVNFITGIIYILLLICFIAFMMALAGVKVEYLLTEQKVSQSTKKAFGLASENKGDLFKKAAGLFLWYGIFSFVLMLLIYLAFVQLVGAEVIDMIMFGAPISTFIASSGLFIVIFILIMLLAMMIGMMFNVSVTAYYLNLNRRDGNQIVGLENDSQSEVQEVKAINGNVEVVKVEDENEQKVEQNEVATEEVEEATQAENNEVEVVEATDEVDEVKTEE